MSNNRSPTSARSGYGYDKQPEQDDQNADKTNIPQTGAGNETRTRDPNLGKVVLYQLSYSRLNPTTDLLREIRPSCSQVQQHRPQRHNSSQV